MPTSTYYYLGGQIWIYLVAFTLLEAMAFYTWQFRKVRGALPQVYSLTCKAVWMLSLACISLSDELQWKYFWVNVTQMAQVMMSYLWYLLMTEIGEQEDFLPRFAKPLMLGSVAFWWLIILTSGWHHLFWGEVSLEGRTLILERGTLTTTALISSYIINALAIWASIRWVRSCSGLRKKQAFLFSISPIFTLLGHAAIYFPGVPIIATQAIGSTLSSIWTTWIYYRWRMFSILPLAQDVVAKNMIDGLVVLDDKDYIVDLNPAAARILTGLPADRGRVFLETVASWPQLTALAAIDAKAVLEVSREHRGETSHYQLHLTPLHTHSGHLLGKVLVFKNITSQIRNQQQMLEQQKALSILEERNRIGREIHDGHGQVWNYLLLELQTLQNAIDRNDDAAARQQIGRIIAVTKDLNTDVRESIAGLKQQPSSEQDFLSTIRDYLDWYERTHGIATRLNLPGSPLGGVFTKSQEVQLLRIIQEALTNIRKHSKASLAEVSFTFEDDRPMVRISDDGQGFLHSEPPTTKKSYGLQIMAERAEEANGSLEIDSVPGRGTSISIRFLQERGRR